MERENKLDTPSFECAFSTMRRLESHPIESTLILSSDLVHTTSSLVGATSRNLLWFSESRKGQGRNNSNVAPSETWFRLSKFGCATEKVPPLEDCFARDPITKNTATNGMRRSNKWRNIPLSGGSRGGGIEGAGRGISVEFPSNDRKVTRLPCVARRTINWAMVI